MEDKKLIESLIKELVEAAELYYQESGSSLSDDEYDSKLEYLRCLTADSTELQADKRVTDLLEGSVAGGSTPDKKSSVITHKVPLLSLKKANSLEEIKDWYDKVSDSGASAYRLQAKLDGFAIEARYENGVGVEMSTRGDGYVGEDMTYLFNHKDISIVGLPSTLKMKGDVSLRGELFARHSQFEGVNKARKAATGKEFENSRNGVVGIVKKGKSGLGYKAELTFCVYSVLIDGEYSELNNLKVCDESIVTIDELTARECEQNGGIGGLVARDFNTLSELITKFGEIRDNLDIPTDGSVIKPLREAVFYNKMGLTSHHARAFIAFKYPSEKRPGTVLSIEYSIGKTGRLTPTAIITPTKLGGVTVSRASCHNFGWMTDKGVKIGSTVMVTLANDVIPAIASVIIAGDHDPEPIPTICPSCGSTLDQGDSLISIKCVNKQCPSMFFFQMKSAVGKRGLDIDGLSNVGLNALCESGKITDIGNLFGLVAADFSDLPMGLTQSGNVRKFGSVRAEKIIKIIEYAKVNTPAYKLLTAMGVDGLGSSASKLLLANLGSMSAIFNAKKSELLKIAGLGEIKAEGIFSGQEMAKKVYNKMVGFGVVVDNGIGKKVQEKGHFAISGKVPADFANRNDFVDYMNSVGWVFDSAPKATTNIIFGNEDDTSSKIKKAKKLGIKIVAPEFYKDNLD